MTSTSMINADNYPQEFVRLAEISGMQDVAEFHNTMMQTVMPSGDKQPSKAQFATFVSIANKFKLNPLAKEIYAFPTKGGGIQPIVSIDGWLRIINSHPEFNGMVFEDHRENGELIAVTCKIYKKNCQHPVEVTEYMDECRGELKDRWGNPTPWGRWPARMLRHKATIQAGRYAFGISGIIDPDEAERYKESGAIVTEERDITPNHSNESVEGELMPKLYPDESFNKNFPKWEEMIINGAKTAEQVIAIAEKKGFQLTESQLEQINNIGQ